MMVKGGEYNQRLQKERSCGQRAMMGASSMTRQMQNRNIHALVAYFCIY